MPVASLGNFLLIFFGSLSHPHLALFFFFFAGVLLGKFQTSCHFNCVFGVTSGIITSGVRRLFCHLQDLPCPVREARGPFLSLGRAGSKERLSLGVLYLRSLLWDPDEVSVLATSGFAPWGLGDSRLNGGLVGVGSDVPCINPSCRG